MKLFSKKNRIYTVNFDHCSLTFKITIILRNIDIFRNQNESAH